MTHPSKASCPACFWTTQRQPMGPRSLPPSPCLTWPRLTIVAVARRRAGHRPRGRPARTPWGVPRATRRPTRSVSGRVSSSKEEEGGGSSTPPAEDPSGKRERGTDSEGLRSGRRHGEMQDMSCKACRTSFRLRRIPVRDFFIWRKGLGWRDLRQERRTLLTRAGLGVVSLSERRDPNLMVVLYQWPNSWK